MFNSNKIHRGKVQVLAVFSFLLISLFYLAACNSPQPFEASNPLEDHFKVLQKKGPGSGDNSDPNPASDLLLVRDREENENGVSKAVIGPAGGVLIHAEHRIEVPAGALNETVELTFSMPVSDTLMFELGPDGTVFNKPVKVIFNYDHTFKNGLPQENFVVVVWNPDTQQWDEVFTIVDTVLNEVLGSANHFSRYAISKGARRSTRRSNR
ncbi:MAG: hypothetical protein ACE5HS_15605 [bacterium]